MKKQIIKKNAHTYNNNIWKRPKKREQTINTNGKANANKTRKATRLNDEMKKKYTKFVRVFCTRLFNTHALVIEMHGYLKYIFIHLHKQKWLNEMIIAAQDRQTCSLLNIFYVLPIIGILLLLWINLDTEWASDIIAMQILFIFGYVSFSLALVST